MSDRSFQEMVEVMPSPSDLKQIKDAVRDLRASSPGSALADLVEKKIRAIESRHPVSRLHESAEPLRWIGQ
ncbi:hypothetical protein [Microvirga terrestris]|uniref:Uncharacterized protein n=1 Tax=Microvirga terrestris TaxID=2791024 RepID=A0ABS0HU32_9HYPH|nr:hypothetical protein [Microvirga terrestris]MBF9196983.1 hypothetical protein [Microvirga terrestris]